MASPTLGANLTIQSTPSLIRKLTVTSGATAGTVLHGGPAVEPDEVRAVQTSTNPTANGFAWTASSTTTITVDFEDDGNDTWDLYVIWYNQAAGGIS